MTARGVVLLACLGVWGCGSSVTTRPGPAPPEAAALFDDVTAASGIDFVHDNGATGHRYLPETMGSGGAVLDADGDGWMDVYLVQAGPLDGSPPVAGGNRLFRNRGDGRFEDVTDGAGVGSRGYGQGAVAADADGDGDTDIYVTNLGPNVLLLNRGDGTFADGTEAAGVGDARWSASAAFLDADGDGNLDLYVANYLDFTVATHRDCRSEEKGTSFYCHPDAYAMAPDAFYRGLGGGRFADATDEAGLTDTTGKGLGVVAADLDGDGRTDIYVANDSTPNFLYRNLGGRFEEVGLAWGVAYNDEGKTEAGMGVDVGDVNGDGRLDVFVTNLSLEPNSLFLGGDGDFRYGTREAGLYEPSFAVLGFGTHLFDADRDGDVDIFVANGDVLDNVELFNDAVAYRQASQLFQNDGTGRFVEAPGDRIDGLAEPRVARGSMLLDADADGRVDLLVCYNDDRARLYRNVSAPAGWIGLALVGVGGNGAALGARVTLETVSGRQVAEVRAGSSYLASSDPRIVFGLGAAERIERLAVRWPDGSVEELRGLAPGRYHRVRQGQAGAAR